MSVQTEIDRLASAKAAIKTAIEGKGVTVPDATLLDGMAALIEGIEAGGDGNFATGTITPADMTASQLEIYHNLGCTPSLFLICAADNTNEVYVASRPKGQSFAYFLKDNSTDGYYFVKHMYENATSYQYARIYDTKLGAGEKYFIVANEGNVIWANRNTSYGFGETSASFVWVAMKEIKA